MKMVFQTYININLLALEDSFSSLDTSPTIPITKVYTFKINDITMFSRSAELKRNRERRSEGAGVSKRHRSSAMDRNRRAGNDGGRSTSRRPDYQENPDYLQRTLDWVQETPAHYIANSDEASLPDGDVIDLSQVSTWAGRLGPSSSESAPEEEEGAIYNEENLNLYYDTIPDQINDLSFGMVMSTNPRLFALVLEKLKADQDYFNWFLVAESTLPKNVEHSEYWEHAIDSMNARRQGPALASSKSSYSQ